MPMIRSYNPTLDRWEARRISMWDDVKKQWVQAPLPDNPEVWPGGEFAPYIGAGTIWERNVQGSSMPLASNSAQMAAWMASHVTYGDGWGSTSLNTTTFGTPPIPVIVVDSTVPGCTYQYMDKVSRVDQLSASTYLTGKIPWPKWAVPLPIQDRSIAIYDRGTGIMREYFYVTKVSEGHWTAESAGYSLAKPGFVDMGETNYATQLRAGSSAVVRLHNSLGFLDIQGLLDTVIDGDKVVECGVTHALAFTCANMAVGPSWPATQADGVITDSNAPHEGQWARFAADVDPHFNPKTGKPYNLLTQVIIMAGKKYGLTATDKNSFVHAFNGQNGMQYKELTGIDPWHRDSNPAYDGAVIAKYGTGANRDVSVSDVPWDRTEWAPMDWGRPDVDFITRSGEVGPYVK